MDHDLAGELLASARGVTTLSAGVGLLIDALGAKIVFAGAPWIRRTDHGQAWLDIDVLLDECGVWSGGEQRVVRIAASLMGHRTVSVSLADDLPGLDQRMGESVLRAMAKSLRL